MMAGLAIPDSIGRFRILSMLGRGAMGVVYLGHDDQIDRLVAIKLIRADLLDTDERESYLQRFRNEAKIAGRCIHANIVGLYDYATYQGNPYLVLEYVDGVGLQQMFPRGSRRSVGEVVGIALQVLDALHYAHGRGIVHRDIKPANILMMSDSTLKITDFGISRLTSMELTATPLLIGTPSYMSPEQCTGSELDGRNDLFALGCVLYELIAGERPFTGVNYSETLFSIVNRPHVPLARLRDDLPAGFSDAIDRALAKNADDRYATAATFARVLERFEPRGGVQPSSVPTVVAASSQPSRQAVPDIERESAASDIVTAQLAGSQTVVEASGPTWPDCIEQDETVVRGTRNQRVLPGFRGSDIRRSDSAVFGRRTDGPGSDGPRPVGAPVQQPAAGSPMSATAGTNLAARSSSSDDLRVHDTEPEADGGAHASGTPDAATIDGRPLGPLERAHLSRCLTEIVGPIAPLLLRRIEQPGMSVGMMTRLLADRVQHTDERAAFLALVTRTIAS